LLWKFISGVSSRFFFLVFPKTKLTTKRIAKEAFDLDPDSSGSSSSDQDKPFVVPKNSLEQQVLKLFGDTQQSVKKSFQKAQKLALETSMKKCIDTANNKGCIAIVHQGKVNERLCGKDRYPLSKKKHCYRHDYIYRKSNGGEIQPKKKSRRNPRDEFPEQSFCLQPPIFKSRPPVKRTPKKKDSSDEDDLSDIDLSFRGFAFQEITPTEPKKKIISDPQFSFPAPMSDAKENEEKKSRQEDYERLEKLQNDAFAKRLENLKKK